MLHKFCPLFSTWPFSFCHNGQQTAEIDLVKILARVVLRELEKEVSILMRPEKHIGQIKAAFRSRDDNSLPFSKQERMAGFRAQAN